MDAIEVLDGSPETLAHLVDDLRRMVRLNSAAEPVPITSEMMIGQEFHLCLMGSGYGKLGQDDWEMVGSDCDETTDREVRIER